MSSEDKIALAVLPLLRDIRRKLQFLTVWLWAFAAIGIVVTTLMAVVISDGQ